MVEDKTLEISSVLWEKWSVHFSWEFFAYCSSFGIAKRNTKQWQQNNWNWNSWLQFLLFHFIILHWKTDTIGTFLELKEFSEDEIWWNISCNNLDTSAFCCSLMSCRIILHRCKVCLCVFFVLLFSNCGKI